MLLRLPRQAPPALPSIPSAAIARARLQRTIAAERNPISTQKGGVDDLLLRLLAETPDEGRAA